MLKVEILSHTPRPEKVISMAGKLCYSQVGIEDLKENLTPMKCDKFIEKLMSMGHESPLEHVTFTFGIEGISRACSHQIVRHRIASYSQQSQRYVKLDQFEYIIPPAIAEDEYYSKYIFETHMKESQKVYDELVERLIAIKLISEEYCEEVENVKCDLETEGIYIIKNNKLTSNETHVTIFLNKFFKTNHKLYSKVEKQAIEDARYVFPNACETKIIVTMNIRTLYHFFEERCCERAQWEIRELATEMLRQCKKVSPILFEDCGPKCVKGKCTEGNMSCGLSKEKKELFGGKNEKN